MRRRAASRAASRPVHRSVPRSTSLFVIPRWRRFSPATSRRRWRAAGQPRRRPADRAGRAARRAQPQARAQAREQHPELALRLRAWSLLLHVLAGALIIAAADRRGLAGPGQPRARGCSASTAGVRRSRCWAPWRSTWPSSPSGLQDLQAAQAPPGPRKTKTRRRQGHGRR
jgi:hypothetical protein